MRQPTRPEINALLATGAATYDQLVALGVEAVVSDDNDAETVDATGCVRCKKCVKCSGCRNCTSCINCSSCDDSTFLGGTDANNGCAYCSRCHGSKENRCVRLYYCAELLDCDRCLWTRNVVGGRNLIYGVQVSAAQFEAAEAIVKAHLAAQVTG